MGRPWPRFSNTFAGNEKTVEIRLAAIGHPMFPIDMKLANATAIDIKFANATATKLSWHVQNFVMIILFQFWLPVNGCLPDASIYRSSHSYNRSMAITRFTLLYNWYFKYPFRFCLYVCSMFVIHMKHSHCYLIVHSVSTAVNNEYAPSLLPKP